MEFFHPKITIKHAFSIGYRCNSSNFLNMHGHRIMSSPFDYMYIDFESALRCIQDEFANYTKDIVIFNKPNKIASLFNHKNTTVVLPEIQHLLDTEEPILCNHQDYYEETLFFNQNYLSIGNESESEGAALSLAAAAATTNMYKWKSICLFFHHNMTLVRSIETLDRRCLRMMSCIRSRNTLLLYINQNTGFSDLSAEIAKYQSMIARYVPRNQYPNIYFAIILYSEKYEDSIIFLEPALFMVKKINKETYWDDMQFDTQYATLLRHFEIDLIEKQNLDTES